MFKNKVLFIVFFSIAMIFYQEKTVFGGKKKASPEHALISLNQSGQKEVLEFDLPPFGVLIFKKNGQSYTFEKMKKAFTSFKAGSLEVFSPEKILLTGLDKLTMSGRATLFGKEAQFSLDNVNPAKETSTFSITLKEPYKTSIAAFKTLSFEKFILTLEKDEKKF